MVGAVRMLANSMSSHPDPGVQEAYHRGRDAYMEDQDLQQEQHPVAYLSGQLHGALLGPKFGAFKGLTGLERTERAALAGGTAGALYGAGSSISRGQNVADTITNASLGGLAGGVFGTGGAAAAEGLGQVGSRIAQLYRGRVNPDVEAARRVVSTLGPDIATYGPKLSPYELQVANQAGVPRIIADAGRERTMALVRSAANTSPEGRQALEEATKGRFRGQAERIGAYIRKLAGATGASDDQVALEAAARREVGPRYRKAYKAGDRALWSPRLEQLAGSSAVGRAVPGAIARGQDRAIVDGFGAFNPKLTVTPDGRVVFPKGPSGVPTYPNIQFWDYVQRELRDAADAARSAGRKEEAGAIADIRRELNAELDKLVPEFNDARGAAAAFFGAQDALEAGQKFVMSNANLGDARRALGAMTPAERELFARGFASDLADKIERTGFNRDVLNSIFINNKPALDKIRMALGSSRADQLEALLRVESLLDAPRKAMLNSTTMRQASEMGLAGGAMATYEGIKEHSFNPSHIMAAAFTAFAVRHGAKVIDANVARKVGELLASDNPAELAKGIKIVTSSPVLFDALRRATGAAARVGAHEQGVSGAIAAGSALKDVFEEETHHGAESREDSMSQ
jgi:hypothetical protein